MRTFILIFFLYTGTHLCAQSTEHHNLLVQFDKNKFADFGKLGKDSINVIMNVRKANQLVPDIYIIKAKLMGDNSGAQFHIPLGLMDSASTISFTEYIALASTDNKTIIRPREYAVFSYQPFDFTFETLPPQAKLYLIPLEDWQNTFKTNDPAYVIKSSELPLLSKYDIGRLTPCKYQVFEQPYIGVFVLQNKIKPLLIIPKRNTPANNKVQVPL